MENGFPHLIFNKNVVMWLKWAFQMRKGVIKRNINSATDTANANNLRDLGDL
jgi:hypothetical protein